MATYEQTISIQTIYGKTRPMRHEDRHRRSWASINHHPFSILDIGAGTGILSLMLAQRSYAETIEAIEIDDYAYEQCVDNFENSNWSDRLFCYHASLHEFAEEIDDTYDLIVCNPPFYSPTLDPPSRNMGEKIMTDSRKLARFQDAMPFEHLVLCASKLLSNTGKFAVIIPFKEEERFIDLASKAGLYTNTILRVRGNSSSDIKRSLLEFSHTKIIVNIGELVIETSRHQYTDDYISLTKNFYLKMP